MKFWLFFVFSVALFSCKPRQFNQISNVLHQSGRVAAFSEPKYRWVEITRDEMIASLELTMSFSGTTFHVFPEQHLATQQMQFWLDAFDAELRKRYANRMQHIPKPKAIVIDIPFPNAFSSSAYVCADARFPQHKKPEKDNQGIMLFPDGANGLFPCAVSRDFLEDSRAFSNYLKQNYFASPVNTKCQVDIRDRSVTFSEECNVSQSHSLIQKEPTKLGIPMTSNYITVQAGLIENFPETEVIAILAHELGHYYNAHATLDTKSLEYFYTHSNQARNGRPPKGDKAVQQLGSELKTLASATPFSIENAIYQNDFYSGGLFSNHPLIFEIACSMSDGGDDCKQKCAPAIAMSTASTDAFKAGKFQSFTAKSFFASDAGRKLVLEFNNVAQECLKAIPVNVQEDNTPVLGLEKMTPTFLDNKRLKEEVTKLNAVRDADAFYRLMKQWEDLKQERFAQAFAKADSSRLSFYSIEQEADEVASEYLSYLGFSNDIQYAMSFSFLDLFDRFAIDKPTAHISQKECRELEKNNFTDPKTGKRVFVSLGGYDDPHHGLCFRVFNLWRERNFHQFKPQRSAPRAPSNWKTVQTATTSQVSAARTEPSTIVVDSTNSTEATAPLKFCKLFQNIVRIPVKNTAQLKASDIPAR